MQEQRNFHHLLISIVRKKRKAFHCTSLNWTEFSNRSFEVKRFYKERLQGYIFPEVIEGEEEGSFKWEDIKQE